MLAVQALGAKVKNKNTPLSSKDDLVELVGDFERVELFAFGPRSRQDAIQVPVSILTRTWVLKVGVVEDEHESLVGLELEVDDHVVVILDPKTVPSES